MLTASFATQISNANMRFASDGGTVVILALLPIANDRMCGAASEKEYEDALRRRYDLRTCARPWRCLRQRRMRNHLGRTCVTWKAKKVFIRTA